jgi:hypothetical protein
MGDYERELADVEAQEAEDANALTQAEELILRVAREHEEETRSLGDLRNWLAHAEIPDDVRPFIRVALWSLLNENKLELTPQRELRISGEPV